MPVLDNPRLVRLWLVSGLLWALAVPAVWIVLSLQLHHPGLLPAEPWLSFGRLWPVHHNALLFGLFSSFAFGLCAYMVPRLAGVPMAFGGLGWLTLLLWNVGVFGGCALTATDGLRGIPGFDRPAWMDPLFAGSQGIEFGEFPLGIDILLTLCFLVTTVQVIVTLLRRAEPRMYVSLWYVAAALIWTTLTYGLGNFLVPNLVSGLRETALHSLYANNLVGLWVVPMGAAAAYYFVPLAADVPLFSYRLAWLGFWLLVLFQPLTAAAQCLFAPLPEWPQTLAIAAGLCVLAPAWTTACNVFLTVSDCAESARRSTALRFLLLGTGFYALGTAMSSALALREMQRLFQFTAFADAAWLATVLGGGVLWAIGGAYTAWQRTAGRDLFSEDMGRWHFWLTAFALGALCAALSAAGVTQGSMLRYGADFLDAVAAQRWAWFARTGAGALLVVGAMLFFFNLLLTTRQEAEA